MPSKKLTARLPESTDEKLRDLAEARGKNLTDTIVEIIEIASTQPDFFTQREASTPRYQWLDDACPALVYLHQDDEDKEGFYCVEKAPHQKKLGDGSDTDARRICEAHQAIKGIITTNEKLTKLIQEGFTFRVPYCMNDGSKVTSDLQRIWCPIIGEYRPVTTCKTLRKGANCTHLHWIDAEAQRPQTSQQERR